METTAVYSKLLAAYVDPAVRVIALKGSTRSSKTYSTLQLLDTIAAKTKSKRLISVVSETFPHLKKGAIRDYKNILENDDRFAVNAWHDTDKTYSYNKGQIEFFSADTPSKVMGPARDILYINECINIEYEIYRQLAIRTTEKIILDYNPAFEFWVDEHILPRADARLIHSTYLDNDMLSAAQIAEIESNRDIDPDWWMVYGLGETGSVEGLIWKKWDIVDKLPPRSEWSDAYVGVDFGYSNPTAIVLVVVSQGDAYIHEISYERSQTNDQIAKAIKDAGFADLEVICDQAEPKSIKELRNYGIARAVGCDSKNVKLGLQIVNRWTKHYTKESTNLIDEARKYRYKKDKFTDKYIDEPVKKFDHGKDAERYVFLNRLSNIAAGWDVTVSTRK